VRRIPPLWYFSSFSEAKKNTKAALKAPHSKRGLPAPLAGEAVVDMMTRARGVSSEKAKRELGWTPHYSSWRTGFAEGLG